MKKEVVRYQDSPWYIRLWRRRWYLMIPWWTLQNRFTPWVDPDTGELAKEDPYNTWEIAWSIAHGTADGKMEYWYTWEEVKERHKWLDEAEDEESSGTIHISQNVPGGDDEEDI